MILSRSRFVDVGTRPVYKKRFEFGDPNGQNRHQHLKVVDHTFCHQRFDAHYFIKDFTSTLSMKKLEANDCLAVYMSVMKMMTALFARADVTIPFTQLLLPLQHLTDKLVFSLSEKIVYPSSSFITTI